MRVGQGVSYFSVFVDGNIHNKRLLVRILLSLPLYVGFCGLSKESIQIAAIWSTAHFHFIIFTVTHYLLFIIIETEANKSDSDSVQEHFNCTNKFLSWLPVLPDNKLLLFIISDVQISIIHITFKLRLGLLGYLSLYSSRSQQHSVHITN